VEPEDVYQLLSKLEGEDVHIKYKQRRRKRSMNGRIVAAYPNFVAIEDEHGIRTTFSYANIICEQVNISMGDEDVLNLDEAAAS
jgi:uncharacterized protein Veg